MSDSQSSASFIQLLSQCRMSVACLSVRRCLSQPLPLSEDIFLFLVFVCMCDQLLAGVSLSAPGGLEEVPGWGHWCPAGHRLGLQRSGHRGCENCECLGFVYTHTFKLELFSPTGSTSSRFIVGVFLFVFWSNMPAYISIYMLLMLLCVLFTCCF